MYCWPECTSSPPLCWLAFLTNINLTWKFSFSPLYYGIDYVDHKPLHIFSYLLNSYLGLFVFWGLNMEYKVLFSLLSLAATVDPAAEKGLGQENQPAQWCMVDLQKPKLDPWEWNCGLQYNNITACGAKMAAVCHRWLDNDWSPQAPETVQHSISDQWPFVPQIHSHKSHS